MSAAAVVAPPGYVQFGVSGATVVAREDAERGLREALADGRALLDWARAQPDAQVFQGRAPTYAVPLPASALQIVVRHAWHGGLLAGLTRDRFRWPGRAPWELEASLKLFAQGVPTPAVIGYVLYPTGRGLCRTDVATKRLPAGADFPALWRTSDATARADILDAVATLVRRLSAAGAHHADLNVKNVYVSEENATMVAYALDVDRVQFVTGDAASANLARLLRSLRKARQQFGLELSDADLARLTQRVQGDA